MSGARTTGQLFGGGVTASETTASIGAQQITGPADTTSAPDQVNPSFASLLQGALTDAAQPLQDSAQTTSAALTQAAMNILYETLLSTNLLSSSSTDSSSESAMTNGLFPALGAANPMSNMLGSFGAPSMTNSLAEEATSASFDQASVDQASALQVPYTASVPSLDSTSLQSLVAAAASQYGVDANLVNAVIAKESGGNPNAVSSAGALGLMQLMPSTAAEFGVTNPLDPKQNIDAGTRYLANLIKQYGGRVDLALAAYNAGPGAVAQYSGIPPYPETEQYVQDILKNAGPSASS